MFNAKVVGLCAVEYVIILPPFPGVENSASLSFYIAMARKVE